jgi:hypothetical protein
MRNQGDRGRLPEVSRALPKYLRDVTQVRESRWQSHVGAGGSWFGLDRLSLSGSDRGRAHVAWLVGKDGLQRPVTSS